MIVITGCTRIGSLGYDVFRATSFQILPIARSTLTNQQLNDEQTYILLLENHLKQNGFYFSYRTNLTLSVQKQAEVIGDWRNVNKPELNNTLYTNPLSFSLTHGFSGIDFSAKK